MGSVLPLKHMATKKWSAEYMIPRQSWYQNRVLSVKFGPSKSSGNAMFTVKMEVVAPTTVEIGDNMIDITGVETTNYWPVTVFEEDEKTVNQEKTKEKRDNLKELFSKLKLNGKPIIEVDKINWENPQKYIEDSLRGKVCLTMMESEVKEVRATPTKLELEEAKKKGIDPSQAGKVLKDPVTGKDCIQYWPKVREIFGLAVTGHATAAY